MTFSRTRRLFLGAGFSVFARGLSLLVHLIVTGIISRFLSETDWGLWLILSQLVIVISACDLGIGGGGFRNALTKENAKNFKDHSISANQALFLSSVYFAFFLYLTLSLALTCISCNFNWNLIFHFKENLPQSSTQSLMSFVMMCALLRAPFSMSSSGFYAFQEAHIRAILEVLELLFLSAVVILCVCLKVSFFTLVSFYYLSFFLFSIVGFIYFLRQRKWKLISFSFKQIQSYIQPLLKVNFLFWLQNIAGIGLFSLNTFLVSITSNAIIAGQFGICQKLFSLMIGLHFVILNPLWSAYSDAYHKQDWRWMRNTFIKSLIFTGVLFALGNIVIVLFYKQLLLLWVSRVFNDDLLVMSFTIWAICYSYINCLSIILNSVNRIKNQVIFLFIGGISNVFLGLYFGNLYGAQGVIFSSIISLIPLLCANSIEVFILFRKNPEIQSNQTLPVHFLSHGKLSWKFLKKTTKSTR